MKFPLSLSPLLQNDEAAIVRYWKQFAAYVNYVVYEIYYFFMAIYPWGWLHLLLGLWMAFMLFWAKEFPNVLRYSYYLFFFLYVVSLPYFMLYYM